MTSTPAPDVEPEICKKGGEGFILPVTEAEWIADADRPEVLRACLYGFFLVYFFLGVSIVADIFMGAIEAVTSRRKQKLLPNGRLVTIRTWNDTVANLTLMALGSSAPEIRLAVTELFGGGMYSGELGPATIVGSAAFNLLMIIALCIFVIPSTEVRKVKEVPVFLITVVFMFIAYIWLVFIVSVISPDVVEPWEAVVTLLLLPVLVIISYLADIGWFGDIGKALEVTAKDVDRVCALLGEFDRETKVAIRTGLAEQVSLLRKLDAPSASDMADIRKVVKKHLVTKKSRAARRVEATRQMTGGKKISNQGNPTWQQHTRVSGVTGACIQDVPVALAKGEGPNVIQFSSEAQCVCEDHMEKPLVLTRHGDLSETVTVNFDVIGPPAPAEMEGKMSTRKSAVAMVTNSVQGLRGKTSAAEKRKSLCAAVMGVVTFSPGQDVVKAEIQKPDGVSAEGECNSFDVEITEVHSQSGVSVGNIPRTLVVVCAAESQGRISFAYERLMIQGAAESQIVQVMLQRMDGCHGKATCAYRTERLTAVPGYAYRETEGTIELEDGVTEAFIDLEIMPSGTNSSEREFLVVLEDVDGAEFNPNNDGGVEQEILTIEIGERDLIQSNFSGKMLRWLDHGVNFDEMRLGNEEYKEQFVAAIFCNGSYEEQQEASKVDWAFHIVALPWKLIFSFVPPTSYCSGWICFWLSLVFIGALTALIGDLAELFGCVIGMPNLLTSITFVALGTSMPDLFASKTAATQDPTADASIVNVTGSNSVNVFLGLGLPWSIGAIYWYVGEWDNKWASKYPDIAGQWKDGRGNNRMVFVVRSGDLVFSVIIFSLCAIVAVVVLLVRRRRIGAELGGPAPLKIASSVSFVILWIGYIFLSGWWSLRQFKADTTEKSIMFVSCGIAMGIPVLVVLGIATQSSPLRATSKESKGDGSEEAAEKEVPSKQVAAVPSTPPPKTPEPETPVDDIEEDVKEAVPASEEVINVDANSFEEDDPPRKVETPVCTGDYAEIRTPQKTPPKDVAEDLSVACESVSPEKDSRAEDPAVVCQAEAKSTESAQSNCCMACCFTPACPSGFSSATPRQNPAFPTKSGGGGQGVGGR